MLVLKGLPRRVLGGALLFVHWRSLSIDINSPTAIIQVQMASALLARGKKQESHKQLCDFCFKYFKITFTNVSDFVFKSLCIDQS